MRRNMIQILAICGSLRSGSSNATLLNAFAQLAPEGVSVTLVDGIGSLPHFNPDLEEDMPPPVADWRRAIGQADALVFCSPEYAHGVPGSLKNALDWLVSGPEFVGKAVGVINASPYSSHAHASLLEILRTMSAHLVEGATVTVPLKGKKLDVMGILGNEEISLMLRSVMETLVRSLRSNHEKDS
jgi:NAD(P)H-dependent FMN reductase